MERCKINNGILYWDTRAELDKAFRNAEKIIPDIKEGWIYLFTTKRCDHFKNLSDPEYYKSIEREI